MGLQIHLIAIFAFFLQAILAARIVQPVQSFGIIADSAIGSATTPSDFTSDLTQSSNITDQYNNHRLENDQPLILKNGNRSESDHHKILKSINIKSSTESPSDNSEPTSIMPIVIGVENVEHSAVVNPTSTTKRSKIEPKPTRITTQTEEMVSESVVKNTYQPMKTKSVKEESNSAKMNNIEDKWRDLEKTFRLYTDSVMKKALPKFLRIHSQLNISSQCNAALLQLVNGLRSFKSWAIKK
ncbi:uncharacterized protein CEXT_135571 [Caerostris extrusa]|uniref:Uncharacterized protein n=1 Tax=Caerostris extrusa TaxID=172846 RepID=A0AAV4RW43_CAEEX|nr:uncharacterized protein CEXT_135571 [Caerostris extrusa]